MSHTQEHTHAHTPAPAQDEPTPVVSAVTLEIAGLEITVPRKFAEGMALTETQARILDAAYQRQFTNNQNANAEARKKRLEAATTEAEKATNKPLTAAEIAAFYTDYVPAIGGAPRQSMMERLRGAAAWRFWIGQVTAHNEAVKNGDEPIIVKAGNKTVPLGFKTQYERNAKGEFIMKEGKKVVIATADDQKETFCARLLDTSTYADGIQEELDKLLAERGSRKTETSADEVVASVDDLI